METIHPIERHLCLYDDPTGKLELHSDGLNVRRLAWYQSNATGEGNLRLMSMAIDRTEEEDCFAAQTTVICDPRQSRKEQAADLVRIARALIEEPEFYISDPFTEDICLLAA